MERNRLPADRICNERIKSERKKKKNGDLHKMSQNKLATDFRVGNCKISRDIITAIESGKRDVYDVELLWFAKMLDRSPYYLMGIDDAPAKETVRNSSVSAAARGSELFDSQNIKNIKNVCGLWLRQLRYHDKNQKRPGFSQEELAKQMSERGFKMTHYTILYIEKGVRRVSIAELKCFADILKVPVRYLLEGPYQEPPDITLFEYFAAEDDE